MEVEQHKSEAPYRASSDSKADAEKWTPAVEEGYASGDASEVVEMEKEKERKCGLNFLEIACYSLIDTCLGSSGVSTSD